MYVHTENRNTTFLSSTHKNYNIHDADGLGCIKHPLKSFPFLFYLFWPSRKDSAMALKSSPKGQGKRDTGPKAKRKAPTPSAKAAKVASMGTKRVTPKKPKARVLRLLKAKEPKLVEDGKQALFLKGTKCPQLLQTVLRDLVRMPCQH